MISATENIIKVASAYIKSIANITILVTWGFIWMFIGFVALMWAALEPIR